MVRMSQSQVWVARLLLQPALQARKVVMEVPQTKMRASKIQECSKDMGLVRELADEQRLGEISVQRAISVLMAQGETWTSLGG